MYNAKELLSRMKDVASVNSNSALAKLLNVSYNTLNTWLKRNKLPQEVILGFSNRYNCSLDYLIKGDKNNNSFKNENISAEVDELPYFGTFEYLNLNYGSNVKIDTANIYSGGFYLLKKNDIYFVAQALINPFSEKVKLTDGALIDEIITMQEFLNIKIGLILKAVQ